MKPFCYRHLERGEEEGSGKSHYDGSTDESGLGLCKLLNPFMPLCWFRTWRKQSTLRHGTGASKVSRELRFPGAWYEINGFQIHLIVADSAPSALQNQEKWGRNRHVAFSVANLEVAKAELLAQNVSIQMSASGRAALFTQDPDGNVIELSEG